MLVASTLHLSFFSGRHSCKRKRHRMRVSVSVRVWMCGYFQCHYILKPLTPPAWCGSMDTLSLFLHFCPPRNVYVFLSLSLFACMSLLTPTHKDRSLCSSVPSHCYLLVPSSILPCFFPWVGRVFSPTPCRRLFVYIAQSFSISLARLLVVSLALIFVRLLASWTRFSQSFFAQQLSIVLLYRQKINIFPNLTKIYLFPLPKE